MLISRFTESVSMPQTNFFQGTFPSSPVLGSVIGSSSRRQKLGQDLARAIANDELYLEYQPQWDSQGQNLVGVEALVRWQHGDLGGISPTEFIPLAEESGLILSIGDWVLREACLQYQAWQKQGLPHLMLGVNLSLQQLQSPGFVRRVQAILQETQMPYQQLQLEVTEGLIFQDLQHTFSVLKHFQQTGIRLAIDDFGTGYSSLSVLKDLPIHTLKIDRSFLDDLETTPKAEVILESIINLGQRLQLEVVAEGVETLGQLQLLQSLQCDVIQGFFFSRPLDVDKITHYLHHSFCSSGSTTAIAA